VIKHYNKVNASNAGLLLVLPWFLLLAMSFHVACERGLILAIGILSLSQLLALKIWGESHLLDPVQAVIIIFYVWFGLGPILITAQKLVVDDVYEIRTYMSRGFEPVFIVAIGLVLFALVARSTKRVFPAIDNIFRENHRAIEHPRVLFTLTVIGLISSIIIKIAAWVGFGITEIDHLGGSITGSWWIFLVSKISISLEVSISGMIYSLIRKNRKVSPGFYMVLVLVLSVYLYSAYYSGWKLHMMKPFAFAIVAYVSIKNRVPWMWCIAVMLLYLLFVEPFVRETRSLAELSMAASSKDRVEVIKGFNLVDLISSFSVVNINLESPFRNIYRSCQDICEISSWTSGPWSGVSIEHGILASMPRFLFPDKPLLNVGNFFANQLGLIDAENQVHNISITMPFELVGNYGMAVGIVGFVFLGLIAGVVVSLLLPQSKLSDSCLNGILVMMAIQSCEVPFGHLIAQLRDSVISYSLIWCVIQTSYRANATRGFLLNSRFKSIFRSAS
jgi:hypothetical protein